MRATFDRRFVLGAGAAMIAGPALSQNDEAVVRTGAGLVRGRRDKGVLTFRGIPYGEPTSGENRFMPPKPKAAWSDIRDCLGYGPNAPQMYIPWIPPGQKPGKRLAPPLLSALPRPAPATNEDCLVLNVWTPATSGKRAVLFWIHGGGFSTGSGSSPWYEGANMALKQDVVVVTINHRLNVFGFCDLSALGDKYAHSGQAGLLDCVLALRWVQQNIDRFGGDPDRIMIHGVSGGGRKTSALMAFEPARGLFQRAGIQSGAALTLDGQALAREKAARLLKALEIAPGDVDKLQSVPIAELTRAGVKAATGLGQWRPSVDGQLLPRHPFEPDAPAISRHVPLLIGSNRTEQSLFLGDDPTMDTLTQDGLVALAAAWLPQGKAAETVAAYRRLHPEKGAAELAYMITTDRTYFLDTTILASRKAAQRGASVWHYVFDQETPAQNGRYFSPHALETPYVFDNLANAEGFVGPATPARQHLAEQMSSAWANFAKTGKPSAAGLPRWPTYDATRRSTMVFNATSHVESDPRGAERRLMASFGSQQDHQTALPPPGQLGGDDAG